MRVCSPEAQFSTTFVTLAAMTMGRRGARHRWDALVRAVVVPTVSDLCPDARPDSEFRMSANSERQMNSQGAPLRIRALWGL